MSWRSALWASPRRWRHPGRRGARLPGATDQARARGRLTPPGHCFRGAVRAFRPLSARFRGPNVRAPAQGRTPRCPRRLRLPASQADPQPPQQHLQKRSRRARNYQSCPRMLRIPVDVPPASSPDHHRGPRPAMAIGGSAPRPAPATASGLCQCQALGKSRRCRRSSRSS